MLEAASKSRSKALAVKWSICQNSSMCLQKSLKDGFEENQAFGDVKCDVLIDVPIAKHHSLARLTLGMKICGLIKNRSSSTPLGQRIADLTSLFRPTLTVV